MRFRGPAGFLPFALFYGLATAVTAPPTSAAEDGIYLEERGSEKQIIIRGEIRPGDAEFVEGVMRDLIGQNENFSLRLADSPGGSVDDALALGRMIRALDGIVWMEGYCYSSCGLVYAGGSVRIPAMEARLGLHRPYFDVAPGGDALSSAEVKQLYADVEAYLEEMNITPEVMNAIMLTAPEDMHVLERDEIEAWLPRTDPVYEEVSTIRMARRYGMSSTEYRHIDQMEFEPECAQSVRHFECMMGLREALRWQLPPEAAPGIEGHVEEARLACRSIMAADLDPEHRRAARSQALQDRNPEPLRAYLATVRPEWTSCMMAHIHAAAGFGQ